MVNDLLARNMVEMSGKVVIYLTYGWDVGVWKVVFWVAKQQWRFSHPRVPDQEHLHGDDDEEDLDDDGHDQDDEKCLEKVVKLLLMQHSPAFTNDILTRATSAAARDIVTKNSLASASLTSLADLVPLVLFWVNLELRHLTRWKGGKRLIPIASFFSLTD